MTEPPQEGQDANGSPVNVNPSTPNNSATDDPVHIPPLEDSNQYAYIDGSGTCTSCHDTTAKLSKLTCLFCQLNFHSTCKDATKGDKTGKQVICTSSFYKTFNTVTSGQGVNSERHGNFVFVCDSCMTTFEQDRASTSESKVDVIDRRVDNLAQSVEEMKSMLNQLVNKPPPPPPPPVPATPSSPHRPSYAAALKRSVLVVDTPDEDQTVSKTVDSIISDNAIHVDKKYINHDKKTVIVLPTEKDCNALKAKISSVIPTVTTHTPPDRLPTISISNIQSEFTEAELTAAIFQSHPDIKSLVDAGNSFSVMKVKKQLKNNTRYQATVRVSNDIRKLIECNGNRIYILSYSCQVYDQFHIKRCNKCQKFGHYEDKCNPKAPVCGHCSEAHHSNNCPKYKSPGFIPCCANCKKGKFDSEMHSHSAFDRSCPAYIAEQNILKKSISYYSSKN